MSKNIIIIGGGISGLSTLHYLKTKYSQRSDVQIQLLEKEKTLGGTASTLYQGNCIFETGPNGFLNYEDNTFQFLKDIHLDGQLVQADPAARKRALCLGNKLFPISFDPSGFFSFSPMTLADKLRFLGEMFVPRKSDPEETIYEFGLRRFGKRCTELFLDAMVTGIYAGDAKKLNLKLSFPKLFQSEKKYGSILGAMARLKEKPILCSLKSGMSQLSLTLGTRYKNSIVLNQDVMVIKKQNDRWLVYAGERPWEADEIFLCVPAFAASGMIREHNRNFAGLLDKIFYAPVAVAGLVFKKDAFKTLPEGFGYLVPSQEGKKVLGVLFESNIFSSRTDHDHFLVRVMMGGSRHLETKYSSEADLLKLAKEEIRLTLGATQEPVQAFLKVWPQAIPQYDKTYASAYPSLQKEMEKEQGLFVVANYWNGISINDCISNARFAAERSHL